MGEVFRDGSNNAICVIMGCVFFIFGAVLIYVGLYSYSNFAYAFMSLFGAASCFYLSGTRTVEFLDDNETIRINNTKCGCVSEFKNKKVQGFIGAKLKKAKSKSSSGSRSSNSKTYNVILKWQDDSLTIGACANNCGVPEKQAFVDEINAAWKKHPRWFQPPPKKVVQATVVQGGVVQAQVVQGGVMQAQVVHGGVMQAQVVQGGVMQAQVVQGGVMQAQVVQPGYGAPQAQMGQVMSCPHCSMQFMVPPNVPQVACPQCQQAVTVGVGYQTWAPPMTQMTAPQMTAPQPQYAQSPDAPPTYGDQAGYDSSKPSY